MNIISLATIKSQKNIIKMQYNKYLAAPAPHDIFNLKEIKTSILNKNEDFDFFYKVNKPLKLNKVKDIYFSNSYDDILESYNDIVMAKGHIYKFKLYNMIYDNYNLNDISAYDKQAIRQVINENDNKILLEIIDLYNYLKDEMILYSEEFSSKLGIKKSYIVLDNEDNIKELINKNKIIIVKASKEALKKAIITTRNDIEHKTLREKEGWISLKSSGYKSFKLYTDAYESYNKFKYENNYAEGLKTFLKTHKEQEIKEVIPELANTKGNLVNERIGCFIKLYDDLDKNKDYYKILKEVVSLKTETKETYGKEHNLNSKEAKEEANNKIKTKALYIAKENIDDYILRSIKSKMIKRYISSKDIRTAMMLKEGSEKILDVSKNEYIKSFDLSELKKKIVKDEDLSNLEEYLYYFNDESPKEELSTLLIDKFNFHKDNVHLFINNILNNEYYLTGNHDGISNIIKLIDNKGYLFITYNEFSNRLEDDLFKCLRHRDIGFEGVKDHIEEYSLVFNLDKIDELITLDDLREIFGSDDRLLNLKEELQKSEEEDFSYMVPACEEILKDHNLINDVLNSALFNTKDMEFLFEHYKKLHGIKESVRLNDFFNIKLGRSFITQEFARKEEYSLKNGEYQGISVKVKFMSEKEYADKCKEMENIESLEEFTEYLIPKYYGENLNYEEKKESLIKMQNMCNKIKEVTSLHKDSGIIDPFLDRIIKANKSLKDSDNENKYNDDHYDINVILGYSQKSILHSASLEENDNLSLAHDIFQILTGAKVENGDIIGGAQIAVNLNTYKNPILPLYINAICNNIQSEKEAEYINNLFKNHMILENENIKKVNGRYKVIENLREHYSEIDITYGFAKITEDIMNSFVNLKMKDSINEIKVNNAGMMDICVTKDSGRDRFNKNAELNYESLQAIDGFMDNIYKKLNSYFKNHSYRTLEIMNSMNKRYLDYMLKNEGFIYNMEQCANLNITLIAQNNLSRYDSEMLYDNDIKGEDIYEHNEIIEVDNYKHNKNEYEKNIKKAEIKNIRLDDAVTEKGYILPEEIRHVFKDTIIKDEYVQKVNAYRINIENKQIDNPLYKDLFSKDINNKCVYEHLSSNYDPKQYAILHNIKPKICEIIIPAFKSKDLEEDLDCNLKNLKKKSAVLINTLYELDKYNFENHKLDMEKEIFVSEKRKNEVHEDNFLIKLKNKAEKKLGDYYESLIYEMTSSNGYFKRSLKSPIENSANLKISNVASPIKDNDGNYAAHMFKKAINDHKYHGIHYVNPKDIFGENYKTAYKTIGKQLITDNIDKSDEFYKYMKNNFISSAENTYEIHKKGESLLKDHRILEKIGEDYLKKIGISSVLINDFSAGLPYIQCVKTYINNSISKGSTYIDYVTANKFHNNEIKAFFEGIRKSENGKYFLRRNEETQDICHIMKVLEDDNYKEFEKSLNEDKLYENYEHAKQNIKIYNNYGPLYEKMDSACGKLTSEDNLNKKGIFKEVYSRNYVEDAPTIDEKKILKGFKIYSVNIDDAGLFRILDILRNKKGNAELKLQDIQSSKVKTIQGKSFDHISKKINYYKIASQNKTDESILNEIKDSIKKEYINDFSKSLKMIDKVFNNSQSENSTIHNKAFIEIRKEYDKDKVNDYINTMMVLKNKNMITKEEIINISEKINEHLKNTGKSKKEFKENFCNILKKSRKFKERNIDTLPKVEKFLNDVITKENIGSVKTKEEIKKAKCHFRINIIDAEDILNEKMQSIIKKLQVKDENIYEIGKDIVKTYVKHIQEEDKNNEQILNNIYNKNAHNQEFLDKVLNINMNSTKDIESIKKVKIGYGTYAGLAIGELSHKSLNKILKKDYSNKLNYKVNEKLLKQTKNAINKAKYLDKEGIINKEGKLITKEKLKSRLGNSYINKIQKLMNEKAKEKGSYRRKETTMYKEASQAIKSAFISKSKDSHKALIMKKYSNTDKVLSLAYSEQNINIEPNIRPNLKDKTQRFSESIKSINPNYKSIPTSDAKYYEQQTTGNAINISAQSTSKSTVNNMSQIISKALGGSNLNINTNYTDSRSMVTHDEISSMIENSMK